MIIPTFDCANPQNTPSVRTSRDDCTQPNIKARMIDPLMSRSCADECLELVLKECLDRSAASDIDPDRPIVFKRQLQRQKWAAPMLKSHPLGDVGGRSATTEAKVKTGCRGLYFFKAVKNQRPQRVVPAPFIRAQRGHVARDWFRRSGLLVAHARSPSTNGDGCPDRLDDAERPCASQKPVDGRCTTRSSEHQHKHRRTLF